MRSELCRGGGHKLFGMIWEHILGLADVIGIAVLNDQIIIDVMEAASPGATIANTVVLG